eukprot:Gregarina_sp_Poly_1__2834@NODE_178_length_11948_cov_356_078613_g158_i0_p2_GENE_NODE_178_length_11948_cov_356_078613_g158_i0NODE_178_length_11948_cov_356_078613_g158_i0_p2_ORF_typecomplete_len717_score106_70CENPC_C/PF11699_8/1_5e03CENPC_C/PF11699_8/4_2e06GlgX_C/PF18390_1/0_15Auxin_BP/PF02041_16/3_1e03Auxin_BP/PF02041_16/0_27Cupin_2/PF07883_11/0_19_NODE_178_length_11948_cov_356_078613_g158_i064358585
MLPPALNVPSLTPLREKDAFQRSTPPLPVRGVDARFKTLMERTATRKLGERLAHAEQENCPPLQSSSLNVPQSPPLNSTSPELHVSVSTIEQDESPSLHVSVSYTDSHDTPNTYDSHTLSGVPPLEESDNKQETPPSDIMPASVSGQSASVPHSTARRPSSSISLSRSSRTTRSPEPVSRSVGSYSDKPFAASPSPLPAVSRLGTRSRSKSVHTGHISQSPSPGLLNIRSSHLVEAALSCQPSGTLPEQTSRSVEEPASLSGTEEPPSPQLVEERSSMLGRPIPPDTLMETKPKITQKDTMARNKNKHRTRRRKEAKNTVPVDERIGKSAASAINSVETGSVSCAKSSNKRTTVEVDVSAKESRPQSSPNWITPRPAPHQIIEIDAENSQLQIVDLETVAPQNVMEEPEMDCLPVDTSREAGSPSPGITSAELASQRRLASAGVQAVPALKSRRAGKAAPPFGDAPLRRVSILDRPKRLRLPPLQWWRNERIEYEQDATGHGFRAKAVYLIDPAETETSARGRVNTQKRSRALAPPPAVATNSTQMALSKGRNSSVSSFLKLCSKYFDQGSPWLQDVTQIPMKPQLVETMSNGESKVRCWRWRNLQWMDVHSSEHTGYKVKLLSKSPQIQTCTVQLSAGQEKGVDETGSCRFTLTVLFGEAKKVLVTVFGEAREQECALGPGDWLMLPPRTKYDIANSSRSKTCTILMNIFILNGS